MDGGIIHREEEIQNCGENNEFRFVHIDLEEPHPNGGVHSVIRKANLRFIRAFWVGDAVLGVNSSWYQCSLRLKSLL